MTERDYVLPFSVFPGIGPGRFASLLSNFLSPKLAYSASEEDLANVIGKKLASDFLSFRDSFSIAEYKKRLHAENVSFITIRDNNYPQKLLDLTNPPFLLYVKV